MADTGISDSEIREARERRENGGATVDELRVFAELKAATVHLRDAATAYKKAQERYQAALGAFNRHVAPESP